VKNQSNSVSLIHENSYSVAKGPLLLLVGLMLLFASLGPFEISFVLCGGVLLLLIFRHEVVHVGFRLRKFHLVHTLPGIPMQEGFAAEHGSELLGDSLE